MIDFFWGAGILIALFLAAIGVEWLIDFWYSWPFEE